MLRLPYKHQADWLEENKNRTKVMLAWQMRLGKTLAIIRWAKQKNQTPYKVKRVLVLCPKSVVVTWQEELKYEEVESITLSSQQKDLCKLWANPNLNLPGWCIANYETLVSCPELVNARWDLIILDEATKIRNPKTKITNSLLSIPIPDPNIDKRVQFRAVLTGTPNPESELDWFNYFKFLFGAMGQFDDFYKFRFKCFYTSGETPGKYLPRPGFTESLANYLNNNANVLSRKDVGIDIPNVIERRYVEMSSEHFRQYKEFEKTWYHDFLKDLLNRGLVGTNIGKLETEWATVAQNYLYQLAIGYPKSMPTFKADHKLNELSNLVTDELKNEKIVIWCYHKRDIEEIRQHFLQEKFDKTRVISGETDTTSLHYILQEFKLERKHGGIQYIIAQIGKAGMGLDLSASDTQIFFSRSWSSLQNEQASNRLIKLGKTGILTIELVTKNTVDEDLHRALLDKRANSNVYKWFLQRTKFESPEKVTV